MEYSVCYNRLDLFRGRPAKAKKLLTKEWDSLTELFPFVIWQWASLIPQCTDQIGKVCFSVSLTPYPFEYVVLIAPLISPLPYLTRADPEPHLLTETLLPQIRRPAATF